jgi:putative spermidine/putrescine transport system substrate-binding protein
MTRTPNTGWRAALCAVAFVLAPAVQAAQPTMVQSIGKGEGALNVIAWEGYAEDDWVKPFQARTGCMVNRKYAGSSDEMVALMRQGGGNQYDLVSASGDATLRLIYGHNVQPINMKLIEHAHDFIPQLQAPSFNTVGGVHYGVSYEWGPNTLLYNTTKLQPAPTSWSVIYDKQYAGMITVPDNPIQIADAALYLSRKDRSLGIKDPYELTRKQLDAAVALLKQQRSIIKKYWALASDEVDLFKNGDAVVGAAWPYQTITLQQAKVPVADTLPQEGVTGWADSWMISAKTAHPNCAYMWINYVTAPAVQAKQALSFGETPANTKACAEMEAMQAGSCAQYHANADKAYFEQIRFWKTPRQECSAAANAPKTCMDYGAWQKAWQDIKG